ncbi:MAG: SdrD B-like domain-containing protein [Chloroflexota bacterium]
MYQKLFHGIGRHIRALINALVIAVLLAGLIPPPSLPHLAWTIAPVPLEPFADFVSEALAAELPRPVTALAADVTLPYAENFDGATPGNPGTLPANWVNVVGDGFDECSSSLLCYDWIVQTGATPSTSPIGPDSDHTTGGGNYLYIEDSGNKNGSTYLISPSFDLSGTTAPQVDFWLHNYTVPSAVNSACQPGAGTLDIDILDTSNTVIMTALAEFGENGDANWQQKTVSLAPVMDQGEVKIRFTLHNGASNGCNDVAIDDVTIQDTALTTNQISGTVFDELALNGIYQEGSEAGLAGVTVTAYDASGSVVGTPTTSGVDGSYALNVPDGTAVRVEFTDLPGGYAPTVAGDTTVQFVTSPLEGVDLGLVDTAVSCLNSRLATSCYINGTAANSTFNSDALVSWGYGWSERAPRPDHLAQQDDIGSTWGLAHSSRHATIYTGSFLKRHVGLLDNDNDNLGDLGIIYATDVADNWGGGTGSSVWIDLAAQGIQVGAIADDAGRGLPMDPTQPSNDPEAFFMVGRVGLGDVEISDTEDTLWASNLNVQSIHSIAINADGSAGAVNSFDVPADQCETLNSLYVNSGTAAGALNSAWGGDGYYLAGTTFANAGQPQPYDTGRFATTVEYFIPLPPGDYVVTTHHRAGTGVNMDVIIDGTTTAVTVPGATNHSETFNVTVTDGLLDIDFVRTGGANANAYVNGIEIVPQNGQTISDVRPFGLSYHNGDLYVGTVCTAEYSQNTADLKAQVYRFDDDAGQFIDVLGSDADPLTPIVQFDLDYSRNYAYYDCAAATSAYWIPWETVLGPNRCFPTAPVGLRTAPQPAVSDIEFQPDGTLVVSLLDRNGHVLGYKNYGPTGTSPTMEGIATGDILRATNNNDGTYTIESGATDADPNSEFFTGESMQAGLFGTLTTYHHEIVIGGMALLSGSDEVVMTAMDPRNADLGENLSGYLNSGGAIYLSTVDGTRTQEGYNLFTLTDSAQFGTSGKAAGLGDLELLCTYRPLEIGNRIWWDPNENGVQDPGEAVIPNVQLELWLVDENDTLNDGDALDTNNATLAATTMTDSQGRYYFSYEGDATKDNANGYADQVWQNGETEVRANRTYQVRIPNYTTASSANETAILAANGGESFALTQKGNGGASNGELRDSNAYDNPGSAAAVVNTGDLGQNNHTFDFGFAPANTQIEIAKWVNTPPTVTVGSQISFTIRITNTGTSIITSLPLTDTYDTNYLTYAPVADASGPNPASSADNDGAIEWTNVIDFDGDNQLIPNETLDIIVVFTARAETTTLPGGIECESAGHTYNIAEALGLESCVEVPLDPPEAKSTIGDWIWHDINNNGVKDTDEPGINGVVVNLYQDGANGGTLDGIPEASELISTTTTADDIGGLGDDTSGTNGAGFYRFEVVALQNDVYLVEVDASNFNAGGALEGFTYSGNQGGLPYAGTHPRAVLVSGQPPITEQNVDFGFFCRFDLALVKTLAAGQSATIAPGDDVRFTVTIYNQGVVTATNVTVADYIPTDFSLSGANAVTWNGGSSGTVTTTLAATLTPSGTVNASTTVDIVLTAGASTSGTYTNTAEIASYSSTVTDGAGNDLPDADSDPDTNNSEDPVKDDVIDEDGKNNATDDEDDHDPASVTVSTTPIYDLALIKTVDAQSDTPLAVGSTVTFTIQVMNQGTATATNPEIVDYVPTGLTVADANWSNDGMTGPVNATRTLNGTIASGTFTTTQIVMTVASIPASRTITNTAEIAVDDGDDVDSTPDSTDGDTVVDNATQDDATNNVDNDNDTIVDEDDHDIAPVYLCDDTTGDLGGTVWRDYNSNGSQDGSEPDFSNATVTAYGNDDTTGVTVPVNPDGTYTFPDLFDTNTHIRLEFDGLPDWMQPSFHGGTPGSAVMTQRHDAATCEADLAVNNPADYCGNNPDLATTCFINGDPDPTQGTVRNLDAVVTFPYSSSGDTTPPNHVSLVGQVGAVWGAAHHRPTNAILVAAIMRRHSGFGPLGTGGIYQIDPTDTTPALTENQNWFDLTTLGITTGADVHTGLPLDPTVENQDPAAFEAVGKSALGDIDFSEDFETLYVMNLADQTLLAFDVGQNLAVPTAIAFQLNLDPNDAGNAYAAGQVPTCTGGEFRPWAIEVQDGRVYVGGVCSAENYDYASLAASGNAFDYPGDAVLDAYVFEFNPSDAAPQLVQVAQIDLNYAREARPARDVNAENARWHPWVDDYTAAVRDAYGNYSSQVFAQPMLTDLAFDTDGSLILGLADRFGYQMGSLNYAPDGNVAVSGISAGDIIRLCRIGGVYLMENGTTCTTATGANNGQGASNSEYYWSDTIDLVGGPFPPTQSTGHHEEITLGGLSIILGSGELVSTAFDPLPTLRTGGVRWFDNMSGDTLRGYQVYEQNAVGDPSTFGKAAGLGDLELICQAAPLEIGNYVWLDADGDGVQDPCEEPIPGVQVSLYNITGTLVAQTTTDANGEYYFSDSSVGNQTWSVGTSLTPSTTYEIQIDLNQTVTVSGTQYLLSDLTPSPIQGAAGSQAFNDEHDSDGVLNGGVVETTAVTGAAGHNDHSFDFGFVPAGTPTIAVDKQFNGVGVYRVNETISFTIRITNTGDVVIDTLPLEDRFSRAFLTFQGASPTETSAGGGIITWADLLDGDNDGLAVGESVAVDVFFRTEADTSQLSAVAPCSSAGHTPNLARSVGATSSAGTVVEDADDTSCDHVQILNPTAVQLAERSMSQTPDGVRVQWSTVSESDIVGFHIWQSNGVVAELRSGDMIGATSAGQSTGASYQWLDTGATLSRGDAYVLEIVKSDGTTQRVILGVMNIVDLFLPVAK